MNQKQLRYPDSVNPQEEHKENQLLYLEGAGQHEELQCREERRGRVIGYPRKFKVRGTRFRNSS